LSVQGGATFDNKTGEIFIELMNPATNAVPLKIEINALGRLEFNCSTEKVAPLAK